MTVLCPYQHGGRELVFFCSGICVGSEAGVQKGGGGEQRRREGLREDAGGGQGEVRGRHGQLGASGKKEGYFSGQCRRASLSSPSLTCPYFLGIISDVSAVEVLKSTGFIQCFGGTPK